LSRLPFSLAAQTETTSAGIPSTLLQQQNHTKNTHTKTGFFLLWLDPTINSHSSSFNQRYDANKGKTIHWTSFSLDPPTSSNTSIQQDLSNS